MARRLNGVAGEYQDFATDLAGGSVSASVFDSRNPPPGRVHQDARHRGFGKEGEIAGTQSPRNWRVRGSVLGIHLAALHAMPAVVAHRALARPGFGGHGFPLADELHPETLGLDPFDASLQQLFTAAQGHWLLKFAIRHVGKAVFVSVDGHQTLGAAVIGRDFVVGDRPLPEIERPESEAMPGPAERAAAERLQQAVSGPIAHRCEVVALRVIAPNAGYGMPMAGLQPFFKVGVDRAVSVVVDAGAQPRSTLHQSDSETGLGQHVSRNSTSGATAHDADVERCLARRFHESDLYGITRPATFSCHRMLLAQPRSGVAKPCRGDGNLMLAQDRSGGALQGGPGLDKSALGRDLSGSRLRQQVFVLDDEEAGGGSHFELGLLGSERFL